MVSPLFQTTDAKQYKDVDQPLDIIDRSVNLSIDKLQIDQ